MTCGQGKAVRQVVCVDFLGQSFDNNECDPEDSPQTEQECSMSPCHYVNHDYGKPIHPSTNIDQRVRSNPTLAILNRNSGRSTGSSGSQWRIGPWGAVSSKYLLCTIRRCIWTTDDWFLRTVISHDNKTSCQIFCWPPSKCQNSVYTTWPLKLRDMSSRALPVNSNVWPL